QTDVNKWQLVDLGEISVPARASGQEPVPTQWVGVVAGGASGLTPVSSHGLQVGALMLLNLDHSPGLMRTAGAGGNGRTMYDTFERFQYDGVSEYYGEKLGAEPISDGGAVWREMRGYFGAVGGVIYSAASAVALSQVYVPTANASAIAALGSG